MVGKTVYFKDRATLDRNLTAIIEGDSEIERTAARTLKMLSPLMAEIVDNRDIRQLTGFIRGISSIIVSMHLSLPLSMREGYRDIILRDIERALKIPFPTEADNEQA